MWYDFDNAWHDSFGLGLEFGLEYYVITIILVEGEGEGGDTRIRMRLRIINIRLPMRK